ncbi:DUF2189 domain-containing protein [Dokdonella immobilis]|uniref:Uncharacterized membrane protein n=1 Tax=Dokdonella immobilis TaxID=578942 RepID=A0A1I5AAG9_9GAMM|nr:DUF2189 domain-containing protein [Dokdonella immobilis]SFN59330.1 Uncharacterized membrane protein [Dokdonella immobilis]
MNDPSANDDHGRGDIPRPFVVPCRILTADAPWHWLRLGWSDLRQTPALSALFGSVIVLLSALVSGFAWSLGRFALLAALLSGFVYIAPLIGVGLYSVSRALLRGRQPRLSDSFAMARRVLGSAGIFALIQFVIVLVWSRSGMMLTAFFPAPEGDTHALMEFLLIGSAIGSVFAALTFATSAFSLPMIADHEVDMVTACLSSINAVLRNKLVMLEWALVICVLTAIGFASALVGLGVVMPWLAYATYHAYRETIDASTWPEA